MSTEETPGQGKTRGGNGQFTRSVLTAQRDALAARLRARNMSYAEIAEKLHYSNESGAHKAVQRALAAVPVEDVAELRAIECERLDEIARRLWKVFDTKYPLITEGPQLVDTQGQYVEDPKQLLAIVDRLMRISERRARLLGLDAAPKREDPAPGALEPAAGHAELLRGLFAALAIAPAGTTGLLALSAGIDTGAEAEAVHRER